MQGDSQGPLIAALDVGTTTVRALLFDVRGRALPGLRVRWPTPLFTTPDGGAEVDPEALVELAVACLEAVMQQAGAMGANVAGVAVSTFWHSLLGVDGAGRPLTPILTWADTRSVGAASALRRRLDERAVHARTGCLFHTSYWPAKLAWLRRRQPRLYRGTARWLSPGEYLFLRLFGSASCSISMASGTGLFDQSRLDWDDELLDALGVERRQLSLPVDLDSPSRGVRQEWHGRLGRLAHVPWFPALGDGACNNVGSGCLSRERIALMIGTSGAMRVLFQAKEAHAPWGLWCYRADRRRYLIGGAISNGGSLYAWLRGSLRLPPAPELEVQLASLEPDVHGLTVLPFLAGERNPGYAARATGTISGLRWHTHPVEILRAGLEAVAYRLALIYELLAPSTAAEPEIVASGTGLLQSPAWTQIIADVLGRPIVTMLEEEASSRGAALLAAEALGLIGDPADAPPAFGRVFEPDPGRHAIYLEGLRRHRRLYCRLLGARSIAC